MQIKSADFERDSGSVQRAEKPAAAVRGGL